MKKLDFLKPDLHLGGGRKIESQTKINKETSAA
jgi:hypothetical protein